MRILRFSFQSTHPHGVRPCSGCCSNSFRKFQSTHPHGVRRARLALFLTRPTFQSTHPHGVRLVPVRAHFRHLQFQSTHPHGVRLKEEFLALLDAIISIHAPAWGATASLFSCRPKWRISIHAPAWGATFRCLDFVDEGVHFNPRTRMGCDRALFLRLAAFSQFQSTHPHGVRLMPVSGFTGCPQFQSTHPHGVRRRFPSQGGDIVLYFNPRTRMGCDMANKLHVPES